MANRYRRWAQGVLIALRAELGGRCWVCGSQEHLEFDCKEPRGDKHHKWETNRRAVFYRREKLAGNLALLCASCHAEKSKWEHPQVCETLF